MVRSLMISAALFGMTLASPASGDEQQVKEVLHQLNQSRSVKGSDDIKSYTVLFDAYMELDAPPLEIGEDFNHNTIHNGMPDWSTVRGWAESNPGMAEAIKQASEMTLLGMPYGRDKVDARFAEVNLCSTIGFDGSLRDNRFEYLEAMDVIGAFATAESYRLMEAGEIDDGLDLMVAMILVSRQCCDREFLAEQEHGFTMLTDMLANLRDLYWTFGDQIASEKIAEISMKKLPFLRPDRSRLFMSEGDRIVSEALIREVFDAGGQADGELFASTFAGIQSRNAPLTRMGAARRWRMIAEIHDSEEASIDRLTLIYDDWWRRWRVQEYDPILDIDTQFDRTNRIRFAAVIYSMQDIDKLFNLRNVLMTAVYATETCGGAVAYKNHYGPYPSDLERSYAAYTRKWSDRDPFDKEFKPFKYRVLDARTALDVAGQRIWLEKDEAILYSLGQDHEDDRGAEHTDDGSDGDIVFWPPIKALLRERGALP
jgi:hypothetical protein